MRTELTLTTTNKINNFFFFYLKIDLFWQKILICSFSHVIKPCLLYLVNTVIFQENFNTLFMATK